MLDVDIEKDHRLRQAVMRQYRARQKVQEEEEEDEASELGRPGEDEEGGQLEDLVQGALVPFARFPRRV